MKKINLILLFVFGLFLVILNGCKKDKETRVFVASGHPAWAPIMYQEGNQIIGAGPEIADMIFKELDLKVLFPYEGLWDVVQAKTKSGEIDMIVAAYKTAERETYMDYSVIYTVDPVSIFVKKGKTFPFVNWNELLSKKGVVTTGDSYGQAFDQYIKNSLSVASVTTPDEAFNLLLTDQADYFVYAYYSGTNYLTSKNLNSQIEVLSNYVSSENFYMCISKKSPLLVYLPKINSILERYKNDGTIDRVIQKYK
ncbi:MAG: transporter substrate-binding domain-containing protein [Candidatus Nomurabacteria bacterium]